MQPAEEFRYLLFAAQREGNRLVSEVLRVLLEHQQLSLIALGDLLVCESGSPSRLVNGLVEVDIVKHMPSAMYRRMVTRQKWPYSTFLFS